MKVTQTCDYCKKPFTATKEAIQASIPEPDAKALGFACSERCAKLLLAAMVKEGKLIAGPDGKLRRPKN